MSELALIKTATGVMIPATTQDADFLSKIKTGQVIRAEFKRMRNYRFHKKFFALLNIGFDAWEPPEQEYKGLPVQKNFDRFRKDCVIAAGYFDPVSDINGNVKAEAHSISFSKMTEDEFEKLYSSVVDVLLQRVLRNYTHEDLDRVVEQIIGMT